MDTSFLAIERKVCTLLISHHDVRLTIDNIRNCYLSFLKTNHNSLHNSFKNSIFRYARNSRFLMTPIDKIEFLDIHDRHNIRF